MFAFRISTFFNFAIIISIYNFTHAMKEENEAKKEPNNNTITLVKIFFSAKGDVIPSKSTFSYTSESEKDDLTEKMSNPSFKSKHENVNTFCDKEHHKLAFLHVKEIYNPLFKFLEKKERNIVRTLMSGDTLQKELLDPVGTQNFHDYLIRMGVSIPSTTFCFASIQKQFIKYIISLKDENLLKIINKIHKDGLKDPFTIRLIFTTCNLKGFYIKDIKDYAHILIRQIVTNPLDDKHVEPQNIPSYMDTQHPENNVKNELALLFTNTDFNSNSTVKVIEREEEAQIKVVFKYPMFIELLMILSITPKVDAYPLIKKWLKKGTNTNKHASMKCYEHNKEPRVVTLENTFLLFIDLLSQKKLSCSNPYAAIELFLQTKADPNKQCSRLNEMSPFELFIDGLNNKTFSFTVDERAELIKLFLQCKADTSCLKKAKFFN